jgi:hypothetical protein
MNKRLVACAAQAAAVVQLELSGVTAADPDGTVLKAGGDGATGPAKPAITCTANRVAPAGVTVTAARAGQTPGASGDYFCQAFFGQEPYGSDTERLPLTISVTGPRTAGATDQVTLRGTSPAFVSSWPHAEDVAVTASLQVTGAQTGSVAISEHNIAAQSNPLDATGSGGTAATVAVRRRRGVTGP